MEDLVFIEKITINEAGILTVKPRNDYFNMIYRSAMGVHWDDVGKNLYFITPIKQTSDIINAYKIIVSAINEEYGKILKINQNTNYEGICESVKNEIAELNNL